MAKLTTKKTKLSSVPQQSGDAALSGTMDQAPAIPTGTGLEELFVDSVKDIFWAENHLVKTLPKMVAAAGDAKLKAAFTDHLEATKMHVSRLEQIFELLGEKRQAKKCDAMEGLAIEGEGVIDDTIAGTPARDAGLIMAAQKVEHYEIASYGGLAHLAKTLGREDIAGILGQTLSEEKEADALLTTIAEAMPQPPAMK